MGNHNFTELIMKKNEFWKAFLCISLILVTTSCNCCYPSLIFTSLYMVIVELQSQLIASTYKWNMSLMFTLLVKASHMSHLILREQGNVIPPSSQEEKKQMLMNCSNSSTFWWPNMRTLYYPHTLCILLLPKV